MAVNRSRAKRHRLACARYDVHAARAARGVEHTVPLRGARLQRELFRQYRHRSSRDVMRYGWAPFVPHADEFWED